MPGDWEHEYRPKVDQGLPRWLESPSFQKIDDPYGGEKRSVSSTGGEKGTKLARHSLIPAEALSALAEHYGKGSLKYSDWNWRRGYEWSKSYDALCRHLTAFWGGEDIDPETGTPHIIAVAWHAFTLYTFMSEHPDFDDRYKK